ncbi:uncharacterized protein LOC127855751 isoform X1 [Dreissena polymorpha]|uniref:uncharacterized protein LOC127855751 isoform X1 n=1 Tax=Dreissena polymorpha TaxID=45954 RepID=UPI0022653618|nr:uncharacterized protein LOC127855751 isoform X1 [Dreissena polymorpha]
MSNIKIFVKTGSKELFEILRDTSMGILNLPTAESASLASEIIHTLNKLTKLYLWGTYTGRCDLKMPASLQCISLKSVECSSEWLCSLWITLSSLDHHVECELCDVVLNSNEEARGNVSHSYLLDLRSELLAHDMSNIEIFVKTGSEELFEILRYTSIGILNLPTADSASLVSEILHTLDKLTKLYLRGTYTGRCDLKMPASLRCISLQSVECSSEWLCSLWITLSSLDHHVECELWDVVLKSNEEARGNVSHSYLLDLRSELLAHDMSNIEIFVKTGSEELDEILRDTSIGILYLPTADSASLVSEILHTLNKLTKLYLRGTYTGRCDLKMPASLRCISLQSVECSSEWLCSLWITLSSLDHQVKCELWDVVLESNEEASGNESHSYLLDLRSELLAHDMSNIEIFVKTGSKELFEILRDTSIGILDLLTADSASLASDILHTLNKLTELYLRGTYTGRCDLKMPASLQCISLQSVECSSEWLCSLWMSLSSLDHQVECELRDVVLKSNEEAIGNELHSYLLDLRSELLAHDMSNIKILVTTGSEELYLSDYPSVVNEHTKPGILESYTTMISNTEESLREMTKQLDGGQHEKKTIMIDGTTTLISDLEAKVEALTAQTDMFRDVIQSNVRDDSLTLADVAKMEIRDFKTNNDEDKYSQGKGILKTRLMDLKLRAVCQQFGRKSKEMKSLCDDVCITISAIEGVSHVYAAFKESDEMAVAFVVTVGSGVKLFEIETCLDDLAIDYVIKCEEFKHDGNEDNHTQQNVPIQEEAIIMLRDCIKEHADQLFSEHRYLSIIKGFIYKVNNSNPGNNDLNEVRLAMYVHAKGYIPIEEEPFTKKIGGIDINVCEGEFILLGKHADEVLDHISMGCQVSRHQSGTLGLFFEHAHYGLCGITSAHVLLTDIELQQLKQRGKIVASEILEVFQPSSPNKIGTIKEVIYKEGDSSNRGLEIGLIAIETRTPIHGKFPKPRTGADLELKYSSGRADEIRQNNLSCVKFGVATGYTKGTIVNKSLPNAMRSLQWNLNSGTATIALYNQVEIQPMSGFFAVSGDSGAPVFVIDGDGELVCVGIVSGGINQSPNVMVTPIAAILEEFGISKLKSFTPDLEQMKQNIEQIYQWLLQTRNETK